MVLTDCTCKEVPTGDYFGKDSPTLKSSGKQQKEKMEQRLERVSSSYLGGYQRILFYRQETDTFGKGLVRSNKSEDPIT